MRKICSKCKVEKDVSEFHRKGKDKHQGHCKECQRAGIRKHYKDNKKSYIDKATVARIKTAKWLANLKKNLQCEECGENHPACLDFHHTDPTQKSFTVASSNRGISRTKKEIEKCIVLCSNCHRKLHYRHAPVV